MAAPTAPKPPQKKRLSGIAGYFVWGSLAICAVVGVSVVMALGIGASRGGFALVQASRPPAQPVVQKPAITEFEVARLTDALRALSADRDRLADRVDQLERSLGDITASITAVKERAASPAAAPPMPPTAGASTPAPDIAGEAMATQAAAASPPGAIPQSAPPSPVQATGAAAELEPVKPAVHPRATKPGQIASRPPQAPRAPKPAQPPQTLQTTLLQPFQPAPPPLPAAPKGPPTQVATIMPPPAATAVDSVTTKTEFAIDLGGEMSIDGLRTRWATIKGSQGPIVGGLRPLVSVREGVKPGTVELRLIAGPMPNAADAAKICASLQTKGIACRTTEFDGQRLSLR